MKNKKVLLIIVSILLIALISVVILISINNNKTPSDSKSDFQATDYFASTDCENIQVELKHLKWYKGELRIKIKVINKTTSSVTYKDEYSLYDASGDKALKLECKENTNWSTMPITIPKATDFYISYTLTDYYDIKPHTPYELCQKFNLHNDKNDYTITVSFTPDESDIATTATETELSSDELELLKEKAPEYFNLNSKDGICILVWQMAEGSYSCSLQTASDFPWASYDDYLEKTINIKSISVNEAKAIVKTYDLDKSKIKVVPIHLMHSSYAYTIDSEYIERLNDMFEYEVVEYEKAYKE